MYEFTSGFAPPGATVPRDGYKHWPRLLGFAEEVRHDDQLLPADVVKREEGSTGKLRVVDHLRALKRMPTTLCCG